MSSLVEQGGNISAMQSSGALIYCSHDWTLGSTSLKEEAVECRKLLHFPLLATPGEIARQDRRRRVGGRFGGESVVSLLHITPKENMFR
ncbi:hypothetical protein EYF80_016558 [Liparis tanakae]|uniref:Uncharacterized protein n=1 Tax=Liparis tanakae TaxID=230148 RepID=A0A4Z2I5D3_9TELE|nr:hypothetical protein EYF80_016558 [Liparis tanakae]